MYTSIDAKMLCYKKPNTKCA